MGAYRLSPAANRIVPRFDRRQSAMVRPTQVMAATDRCGGGRLDRASKICRRDYTIAGDGGTVSSGGSAATGIARLLARIAGCLRFRRSDGGLMPQPPPRDREYSVRNARASRPAGTHHRDEADNADTLLWIESGVLTQIARRGEVAFDTILRSA